jgi:hypothetical protein
MVPNWQGDEQTPPRLGREKLNETFQIEILARAPAARLARGSPGRIQCQFPGKPTLASAHAPTMPYKARSSLAYPNV